MVPCSQNHSKSLAWKGYLEVTVHVLPEARITSKCDEVSQGLVQPSTEALHKCRFLWGTHLSRSLFLLPHFERIFTEILWPWASPKYFFQKALIWDFLQRPHKCKLFILCLWKLMAEKSVDWRHVLLQWHEQEYIIPGLVLVAHPSF